MNPLVYVIFFLTALIVVAIIVVNVAALLTTQRVKKHYNNAVRTWQTQGIEIVYGPALANFLNSRHSIGADGNGALMLSRNAVRFAQITRTQDIVIPLEKIVDVLLVTNFNGRRSGASPYLVIKENNGQLTGFQTDKPERWIEKMRPFLTHASISANSADSIDSADRDTESAPNAIPLLQP